MMFVRNFRLFPAVKEFCKSVKIRRELCYEFGVFLLGFFGTVNTMYCIFIYYEKLYISIHELRNNKKSLKS